MKLLVKHIGTLVGVRTDACERVCGVEMGQLGMLRNAWLLVEDGRIAAFGAMEEGEAQAEIAAAGSVNGQHLESGTTAGGNAGIVGRTGAEAVCRMASGSSERGAVGTAGHTFCTLPADEQVDKVVDAQGGMLFPSFCDSHTHLVYAGSREQEFLDKINGLSYEEIARRGGGILNSVDRLRETSEEELYEQAMERVREIMAMGTGAVEIKSGYGLSTVDELKMLRVIRRIREESPLEVRATFLGAHAVAREYAGRQAEYVELVCREMIPAVAAEGLADFVDVFCDVGFFTVEETARMLEAGAKYGLAPKIHANELAVSGGVQVGVAHDALSVDHLERMGAAEIEALRGRRTMPTLLPGAAFFLGMSYPPAREMIESGLGVALASDYNPGSSPSGNMRMVVALASIRMRMTPTEALNAATLNGAYAMGLSRDYGSVTIGKAANFFITKPMPSVEFLSYAYSTPLIRRVFLRGEEVVA